MFTILIPPGTTWLGCNHSARKRQGFFFFSLLPAVPCVGHIELPHEVNDSQSTTASWHRLAHPLLLHLMVLRQEKHKFTGGRRLTTMRKGPGLFVTSFCSNHKVSLLAQLMPMNAWEAHYFLLLKLYSTVHKMMAQMAVQKSYFWCQEGLHSWPTHHCFVPPNHPCKRHPSAPLGSRYGKILCEGGSQPKVTAANRERVKCTLLLFLTWAGIGLPLYETCSVGSGYRIPKSTTYKWMQV